MKTGFFALLQLSILTALLVFHLPKKNESVQQFAPLNNERQSPPAGGNLLAEPKYRPLIPPKNVMANPLVKPKHDDGFCMQLDQFPKTGFRNLMS